MNQNYPIKMLSVVCGWLLMAPSVWADDGGRFAEEFEAFTQRQQAGYRQFADAADSEFSEWLDQAWRVYRQFAPRSRDLGPKLPTPPVAPDTHVPDPSDAAGAKPVPDPEPAAPADDGETGGGDGFIFFGDRIAVPEWPGSMPLLPTLKPNVVSSAWRTLSGERYQPVLTALRDACERLECGDWARMLLVRDYCAWLSTRMGADASQRALLQWFLLDKLGYRVRGGRFVDSRGSAQLVVLYHPRQLVYGTTFFVVDSEEFFPMRALPKGRLFSYPGGFSPAASYRRRSVDLSFSRTLRVPGKPAKRTLTWPLEEEREVTLHYDAVRRIYLDSHPQVDLQWYFSAPIDPVLAASMRRVLVEDLRGLTLLQQANRLLHFVQFAVPYEIDATQFGRENYLLPEQLLYYPAADCEDRSIFYAALVETLLEIPVVGVRYPGHVTAAVALPKAVPVSATSVAYAYGDTAFHLADPSYIGAGIGEIMRNYRDKSGELIIP